MCLGKAILNEELSLLNPQFQKDLTEFNTTNSKSLKSSNFHFSVHFLLVVHSSLRKTRKTKLIRSRVGRLQGWNTRAFLYFSLLFEKNSKVIHFGCQLLLVAHLSNEMKRIYQRCIFRGGKARGRCWMRTAKPRRWAESGLAYLATCAPRLKDDGRVWKNTWLFNNRLWLSTDWGFNKQGLPPPGFLCRPCVWWSWKLWLHCPAGLNTESVCVCVWASQDQMRAPAIGRQP